MALSSCCYDLHSRYQQRHDTLIKEKFNDMSFSLVLIRNNKNSL